MENKLTFEYYYKAGLNTLIPTITRESIQDRHLIWEEEKSKFQYDKMMQGEKQVETPSPVS